MGAPFDLTNILMVPLWGLLALGISLLGTLVAGAIAIRLRRVPAWILALVPLAGIAAWAAITAPTTIVTLTIGLASVGLAVTQLIAGALGLTPAEERR